MIWRLMRGALRLERKSLLNLVAMTAILSWQTFVPAWIAGGILVLMALGSGFSSAIALARREVLILPLGQKELNHATWLLVVLVPTVSLLIGRSLGMAVSLAWSEAEPWAFPVTPVRMFYEVIFFALVAAVMVLKPERDEPDFRNDPGLYLALAGFLVTASVPFVVASRIPTSFNSMTPVAWMLTLLACVVAVVPLVWTRRRTPRVLTTVVIPGVVSQKQKRTRASRLDALQGLWRLLPGMVGIATAWVTSMLALLMVVQSNSERATIWRPFDPTMTEARFLFTVCIPLLFLIGSFPGVGSRLRALRTLPLSRSRLAVITTVAPTLTPLFYWLALLVIHLVVTGAWPETMRVGYLLTLIGVASLVDAVGIRSGYPVAKVAFGAAVLLAFDFLTDGDPARANAALALGISPLTGIALLALALLVNYDTLTRSTGNARAYRFGRLGQPQGAR